MSAEVFVNEQKYKRSLLLRTFYIGIAVCVVLGIWWFMGKPEIPASIKAFKQPPAEPVKSTVDEEKPAAPLVEPVKAVETSKPTTTEIQHQKTEPIIKQVKKQKNRGRGVLGTTPFTSRNNKGTEERKKGDTTNIAMRELSDEPPILSPVKSTQYPIVEAPKHDPIKEALERAQAQQDAMEAFDTYSRVLEKLAQSR